MGTRGLTMVISKAETKIAQYGQWDHYPSGVGSDILNFLTKCDLSKLKERVEKLRWLTKKEIEKINKDKNWIENYHYLSRDMGGKIIEYVYNNDVIGLINLEDFFLDSVFNEYTYVIDLDKNTFEIYKGFTTEPLKEGERFYHLQTENQKHYPISFLASFDLLNLPSDSEFNEQCKIAEGVDEDDE